MAFVPDIQSDLAEALPDTECAADGHNGSVPLLQRLRSVLRDWVDRLFATVGASSLTLFFLPILLVMTSRRLQRFLFAIALLNISFQIRKHLFLREAIPTTGLLEGFQISLTGIALTGLCAASLIGIVLRSRSFPLPQPNLRMVTVPASLLLVFYAGSLSVAGDVTYGVFQVWCVLVLFLLYIYVATTVTSRADVLFIVRVLLIGAVIQCSLMLAQAAGTIGEINFYFIKTVPGSFTEGRVIGTLGSPNAAAAYLVMMMVFALGVLLGSAGRGDKCLAGAAFSLAGLSLVFTGSRGGWTSFLVGITAMMFFGGRRVPWKIVGALVVVLALLAVPFRSTIIDRLFGDDKGAAESRIPMDKVALLVIRDHPIIGVGANNYPLVIMPYMVSGGLFESFVYTVHNTYLLTWCETGIGGIIAFVWLLGSIVRQGIICWRCRDPLFASLALGCSAAVVGLMVHMNSEGFRTGGAPAMDLMWLFGGLVTAMSGMSSAPRVLRRAGPLKREQFLSCSNTRRQLYG